MQRTLEQMFTCRVQATFHGSKRRVCRALEQPRNIQCCQPAAREDEALLIQAAVKLATQFGGYINCQRLENELT